MPGVAGGARRIDDRERYLEVVLHQLARLARKLVGAPARSPRDDEFDGPRRVFVLSVRDERQRGEEQRRERLHGSLERVSIEHGASSLCWVVGCWKAARAFASLGRCRLRAAKRNGFDRVGVERSAIESRRVARLQLHRAVAEREPVLDQRRARLQEAVHLARVVDLPRCDAAFHPAARIARDAVAEDGLHPQLPDPVDRLRERRQA